MKFFKSTVAMAVAAAGAVAAPALAEVGDVLNRSMSQNINLEGLADGVHPEAEHAFIKYMRFYVPAQAADGTATVASYYNDDLSTPDQIDEGDLAFERAEAKPLIGAFVYGPVIGAEPVGDENAGGFVGFGRRDAYGAVSLDGGETWKTTNLSDSAFDSSFTIAGSIQDPADPTKTVSDYPGDVVNIVSATAGKRAMVAWPSRYCGGSAAHALDDTTKEEIALHLGIDNTTDLYLQDLFGVSGAQGSVDYSADYPSIGEVPYNCLWTARGVLVEGDDPRTDSVTEENHMVWYKAERLTSGRRDVNRVEIAMVAGAGASVIWQEDPDGLRPGSGDGPGEGWSGAIAHNQTDVWYSFLPWEHFETVNLDDNPVPLTGDGGYWPTNTEKPQHYVPFAVPVRLTNNAKCDAAGDTDAYCDYVVAEPYGLKDQCVDTVTIPVGQGSQTGQICVSEDGLPNVANTAATRARMALQPRDSDGDGETDSAWVQIISEEDKGFGRFAFRVGDNAADTDGTAVPCTVDEAEADAALPGDEVDCEIADRGKNVWYFSFDMGDPQTSADLSDTGLVRNLVSQGNLLNQPEVDWRTGETLAPMDTADMWDFVSDSADYNYQIYRTEIARRGSLMVQPLSNEGGSGLLAMLMYKQGLLNQGGPADIMARRVVNAGASDNPYDFANIVCGDVVFSDGSNPYYPKGVCNDPALNLSTVTPQQCEQAGDSVDDSCPTIDSDGIASTDPADQQLFNKLETWIQCPGSPECGTNELSTALGSNLDDQSWYNPLDLAKGHRGYIWGDMVVAMYAWSPNWKLNAKGSDRYDLYIRRSFDGGETWTTTPVAWGGNGTTTCEFMRDGDTAADNSQVCTTYAAGADEQARNVSQLQSDGGTSTYRLTILDPRYAPDPATMPTINDEFVDAQTDNFDVFNPSRFFVVYETGDNTTVAEGEAEPLDLNFGRAVNYGDYYQVFSDERSMRTDCAAAVGVMCNEFARLNTGQSTAEESALAMSPSGNTLYASWGQFSIDPNTSEETSDAAFARVWYDDDNIFTMPPEAPPIDDPTIGDGGGDDSNGDDGDGNGNDDDDDGPFAGCSVSGGSQGFDPLLPGLLLLALGYLGLRRTRDKTSG